MMKAVAAVTCTNADQAYPISATHILAHRVVLQARYDATGRIFVGDSTLKPSTNTGVFGFIPIPANGPPGLYPIGEESAPNGVDLALIYVSSTVGGDIALVNYYES